MWSLAVRVLQADPWAMRVPAGAVFAERERRWGRGQFNGDFDRPIALMSKVAYTGGPREARP